MGLQAKIDAQPAKKRLKLNPRLAAWGLVILVVIAGAGLIARQSDLQLPGQPPVRESGAIKIITDHEGIYRLDVNALRQRGLDLRQASLETLRLVHRGQAQPYWITGEGVEQALWFYAAQPASAYSPEAVYWLSWGSAAPVWQSEPASPGAVAESAVYPAALSSPAGRSYGELRLEEQALYFPQVETGEHFLWKTLSAPSAEELQFTLQGLKIPPGSRAFLRLEVWASTDAPVEPDHLLRLQLNDSSFPEQVWDGRGRHTVELDFDAAWLREGSNELKIELPGLPEIAAELVYIDYLTLLFPQRASTEQGAIYFWSSGGSLSVSGSNPPVYVFDVTDPYSPTLAASFSEGATSGWQVETAAGRRYLAAQEGLQPKRIEEPVLEPDLRQTTLEGGYLAVGPPDLLEPLKPLLDLRSEKGLAPLALPLQAVFDQFGSGYPEPEALESLLIYARKNWGKPPEALLLVGDATYDPRGYLSDAAANRLPTFLVDTVYGGQTATDLGFAQLNADPWPDLPVGRLPAQNPAQVAVYVSKVLAYEADLSAHPAPLSVRAIADGQEASFTADAQAFLNLFPPEVSVELFAPQAGAAGSNELIQDYFEQDTRVLAYFGHGSLNMWGKDRLFSSADVEALQAPERLPVVLNMTCLTGMFIHPKVESLAETLLWKADGGAVAVLAPSSLTLPYDQSFLSEPLALGLTAPGARSLGELHLAARRKIPLTSPGAVDVMRTFMLFGDPALSIPGP